MRAVVTRVECVLPLRISLVVDLQCSGIVDCRRTRLCVYRSAEGTSTILILQRPVHDREYCDIQCEYPCANPTGTTAIWETLGHTWFGGETGSTSTTATLYPPSRTRGMPTNLPTNQPTTMPLNHHASAPRNQTNKKIQTPHWSKPTQPTCQLASAR
jgi:hypothetical protein